MKLSTIKYTILAFIILALPFVSKAQNNTSSPYSYFGVGDYSNVAYGKNLSLGGTGYAMRDKNYLNFKNPASLTSIDSLSVLFEMGVFGKVTQNSTTSNDVYNIDGNMSHIALGHRINSRFMTNYGVMPYTEIGYLFRTVKSAEGENSMVVTDWKGSGGIDKYFFGIGAKVFDKFSLGAEASLMYGPITKSINTTPYAVSSNNSILVLNTRYLGVSYKGAFQYHTPIGDKGSSFTLGGVFSPQQIFAGKTSVDISQFYGTTQQIIYSDEDEYKGYRIPMNYGGGLGYTWRNKYFLTADFEADAWSANNSRNYKDRQVYSIGLEMLPQESLKYMKRVSYRIGYRYDTGYFKVNGIAIDDARVSIGAGFPLQKTRSTVNFTLEAGQRGTKNAGMIRERYTKFTVSLALHDYWFIKRKID